jgi:hypothetical protein
MVIGRPGDEELAERPPSSHRRVGAAPELVIWSAGGHTGAGGDESA